MRIAFLKICFLAIVFVSCSQNKQNTSGGKMVKDYSVLTMYLNLLLSIRLSSNDSGSAGNRNQANDKWLFKGDLY